MRSWGHYCHILTALGNSFPCHIPHLPTTLLRPFLCLLQALCPREPTALLQSLLWTLYGIKFTVLMILPWLFMLLLPAFLQSPQHIYWTLNNCVYIVPSTYHDLSCFHNFVCTCNSFCDHFLPFRITSKFGFMRTLSKNFPKLLWSRIDNPTVTHTAFRCSNTYLSYL